MNRTFGMLLAAFALSGCASTATVTMDENVVEPAAQEPVVESQTATTSEPPAIDVSQATSGLSAPVLSNRELDLSDVSISTSTYELIFDGGTEWEIGLAMAVPEGWTFDPELPGFTNDTSSLELVADCAGACEIKGWDTALNADGQFFDEGGQLFPANASLAFFGGSSDRGDTSSTTAALDDGSGVSLTAHTRHDVGRFVGCTAVATAGSIPIDQLTELCQAIELDWSIAAASTPEYVITERLTDEAAAAAADPAPALPRQTFSVDDDGLISIALPPGSTVSEDGEEVELPDTMSIFTDLELDATCDGVCGPQDWGPKLQETRNTIGRARLGLGLGIVNDSPIDGGWLLSGADGDDHLVLVVKWNDQSERFFVCEASIDERDLDIIDDMLNICLSAEPDWSTW